MAMHRVTKSEQMQRFEEVCRSQGLPLTVQRRAVLESVLGRNDHPNADQVYEEVQVRIPGVSRTTVYRVLDMLVRVGVITRACHPGAIARYDGNTDRHHHLVCLHCDRVVDLEDKRLDLLRLPDTNRLGFEILDFRVQLRGICSDCRKKATGSERKPAARGAGSARIGEKRKRKTKSPNKRSKQR